MEIPLKTGVVGFFAEGAAFFLLEGDLFKCRRIDRTDPCDVLGG